MHMTRPSQETHTTTHRYVPPLVIIFSQVFAVNNIKCVFVVSSTSLSILKWIDLEQLTSHKEEVAYEEGRKWNYMFNLIREEEREKKMKIRLEKQRLEKEKKEQEEKDLREAEREKKRERELVVQGRMRKRKKMQPNGRENTPVGLSRFMC
jgi:hypothetical protein